MFAAEKQCHFIMPHHNLFGGLTILSSLSCFVASGAFFAFGTCSAVHVSRFALPQKGFFCPVQDLGSLTS
jgi:hypothetical protein